MLIVTAQLVIEWRVDSRQTRNEYYSESRVYGASHCLYACLQASITEKERAT